VDHFEAVVCRLFRLVGGRFCCSTGVPL